MLRTVRTVLAVFFWSALTLLFLDFTGVLHRWLGWTAKIQFFPALLALNLGAVAAVLLLTLLVGRVYCSVICPLGVMQDIVSWLGGRRKKRRFRFCYSKEKTVLRYSMLAVFVFCLLAGVSVVVSLLEPYSLYGRIAGTVFAPVWRAFNNLFACFAERAGSYAFYAVDGGWKGLLVFAVAFCFLILLFVLAWRNGRTWCNTVCPVGTLLGLLSRYSLFRVRIDTSKCNACGLCARQCKASCIDSKQHRIDYSRCVACMDCIDACRHGAIRLEYAYKRVPSADVPDASRRRFLGTGLLLGTTALVDAQTKKVDGGLAVLQDKQSPRRATPVLPAGAWDARRFAQHCTACQLCVSSCPNNVLRPSTRLTSLMQPEMTYERGYCRPECNRCSEVCPAGAIRPITLAEKSSTQIGHAVWIPMNCLPLTDGVQCGNCARHCPAGAIRMVPSPDNAAVKVPAVDTERCIGCGACEHLCPARPFSAIYVEGHDTHRLL